MPTTMEGEINQYNLVNISSTFDMWLIISLVSN